MLFLSETVEPIELKGNVASPEITPAIKIICLTRNHLKTVDTDQVEINMSSNETRNKETPVPASNHQMRRKQHATQTDTADVLSLGPLIPTTSNPNRKK